MDKRSAVLALTTLLLYSSVLPQSLYRYKDVNGDWVFTDRRPDDGQSVEVSSLPTGIELPTVTVTSSQVGGAVQLDAHNTYAIPVEVIVGFDELKNVQDPEAGQPMRWVVPANSNVTLLALGALDNGRVPEAEYRYMWLPGEPGVVHRAEELYRAPFNVATDYPITQTFPTRITHQTPDSYYAVDLAMPIGTGIYAARGGIVFEVASTNFRGGTDPEQDAAAANVVRIMHDDGSHAIYAHLNWNSIRVRPGERVERGEYIADSGNTGFSTGPHLHFVVLVNRGARLVSVPVVFEGANAQPVQPLTGNSLVAY